MDFAVCVHQLSTNGYYQILAIEQYVLVLLLMFIALATVRTTMRQSSFDSDDDDDGGGSYALAFSSPHS